jgi:uncharacterized protein (DUF1800 family)
VRLAEQATFGPTAELVTQIEEAGAESFVENQFATPATGYSDLAARVVDADARVLCPAGSPLPCRRDNYTAFPIQGRFFRNALTAPDQLRQRVAFALSQIFVVSGATVRNAYGLAQYQQMLLERAFGNFRELLYEVTLSPAMGTYLDMVRSDKTDANENYARELLQLFSVGLVRLNPDGTPMLDGRGEPIPTYAQETIKAFAAALTGWSYPPFPGEAPAWDAPPYYLGHMVPFAEHHDDTTVKVLLDGQSLPAGQSAQKDLDDALDNVFNHPNVGPFVATRLIQHLVTSNPPPGYVARISAVFGDNGEGVRGDLRAVVRAILLDPEARGGLKSDASYGKVRDPVLFLTGLMRTLGGRSDGVHLQGTSGDLQQPVFNSPSVFNFYPPDYSLPGSDLLSPESAILTTVSVLGRANAANSLLMGSGIQPDPSVEGSSGTDIDWSPWEALAADTGKLLDRLNLLMMHNTMPAEMRTTIAAAVEAVPAGDRLKRAKTAAYLVATSAQYLVER